MHHQSEICDLLKSYSMYFFKNVVFIQLYITKVKKFVTIDAIFYDPPNSFGNKSFKLG